MKLDADEKDLLNSVERGEWKAAKGGKRRARAVFPLRKGYVPQGPAAEHPTIEQGPGSDPEAGTRGGPTVSNADLEPAAQVRLRPAQGALISRSSLHSIRNRPQELSGTLRTAVWPFQIGELREALNFRLTTRRAEHASAAAASMTGATCVAYACASSKGPCSRFPPQRPSRGRLTLFDEY